MKRMKLFAILGALFLIIGGVYYTGCGDDDGDGGEKIVDNDGDGYDLSIDCNDDDPNIHPEATEICGDGIDQDCNGEDLACVGLDFTADSGKRVDNASVPFVLKLSDGQYRLFFNPGPGQDSTTAISSNGYDFTLEAKDTVKGTGGDTTILKIGNYYRIFYLDFRKSDEIVEYSRVKSATSETGLDFSQGVSIVYSGGSTDKNIVSVPDEIILPDGKIRMFYVADFYGKNNIRTAISNDNGASFTFEAGNICGDDNAGGAPKTYVDPDIIKLSDGTYKLYVMSSKDGDTKIYSFSSTDCQTFTLDSGVRIKPSDFTSPEVTMLFDPEAVLLPDGSLRIFCGANVAGSNTPCIVSAISQ